MNNKLLLIPATIAAMTIGTLTVKSVSAQTDGTGNTTLIQKIATKFGLNEADVKSVFDAHHTEREAAMEQRFTSSLDQAVKDGKLTQAQKQLIINKRAELKTQREADFANHKDPSTLTDSERQAQMNERKAEMDSLKTWADQNGIDIKYLMLGHGFGRGFGPKL